MHVLATRPGGYAAGEGVVDLRQTPGDVVILSAADTDLALLARACDALPEGGPSFRLASLLALRSNASVDLYFDSVLERARVVVVALIGGVGYWPYGVERLWQHAHDNGRALVVVPGDDTVDPEIDRRCTVDVASARRIWRYLREGGAENARALLDFIAARFFERGAVPLPARELPRVCVYHPQHGPAELSRWRESWRPGAPVAALVFYRAHLEAGNLGAFDVLITELEAVGINPLPIALASLKDERCRSVARELCAQADAAIILNTTGFAIGGTGDGELHASSLGRDCPVLQVIASGGNIEDWRAQSFGLSPRDLAMNVVIPEMDGRIITRAVSFKGLARRSQRTEIEVTEYQALPERARFVAELAQAWIRLARTPRSERRVALVLANYPARDGRIGNGVGLDTPASALEILRALAAAGYSTGELPRQAGELMARLLGFVTNAPELIDARPAAQSLSLAEYLAFLAELPPALGEAIEQRWGPPDRDPRFRGGRFVVSGFELGALFVGVQPARGYEIDVTSTYHDPLLVPPHGYLAFYAWLRRVYGAHAIVHVGKHGNLEWLPGKSVALSDACWPDAVLGPLPHLYPFIVNDPGEGTQAKRRAQAVIIDHLVPPLTRAESYGPLRDLEKLVDEYYQASLLDDARARLLRKEIVELARAAQLSRELGWSERGGSEEQLITRLDAYLCELKESQIRDGLHVFGRSPMGPQRLDTLLALSRQPAGSGIGRDRGLMAGLAEALLSEPGSASEPGAPRGLFERDASAPWDGLRPAELVEISSEPWRSTGDTRERLELFARAVLAGERRAPASCRDVVERVEHEVAPLLDACGEREIGGLLAGLDGRFVEPGPSGAPSRGRLDVLPTGRNFYSVDVRAVPTPAAMQLGKRAAERLVQRYVQDHGEYPRAVALSVWGTATMRTGGDDVAQALALLGVRPLWADGSGRVVDTEILPLSAVRRPRVDVTLRISGFFRDAFPELIVLFDAAVRAVAALDEGPEQNPIAARVRAEATALEARGWSGADASRRASHRVFGSEPGAYGAGVARLVESGAYRTRGELAQAFIAASAYAYGSGSGERLPSSLSARLSAVDVVLQNQDNREHDVLDSSDYYEFQGGLAAAVELERGAPAALYFGSHENPEAPKVRALEEEVARVLRGRAVNPKWMASARRHGYKGASEMAATVEHLIGYAATTDLVKDYQFALVSDAYVLDAENAAFFREHNPHALVEIVNGLLGAIERGHWREPGRYREQLENVLLDVEEGLA